MPYYSFVLLCYNNWNLTEQAIMTLLDSFSSRHKKRGIELIVVNNGSIDETKTSIEKLKKTYSHEVEIIPVHLKDNMGYPVGVNKGLANCRGQIITVLNNDLVFPSNWFDGIVHALENNSSIGVAAPFLSYGSGPENVKEKFDSQEEMKEFAKQFMEKNKKRIIYTQRIIGACLSFRKELLNLIGGNDFWFGLGHFDDDDWSLRAGITGYKLAIIGASFVEHIGTVTFRQDQKTLRASLRANRKKFEMKWSKSGISPGKRKEIIDNTEYSKDKHFFPLKKDDFNNPSFRNNHNQKNMKENILLVADWTNDFSQWKNKLVEINNLLLSKNKYDLYLWVPTTYFSKIEVKQEIEKMIDVNSSHIHFVFDEIYPVDIMNFLIKYQIFIAVEGDYVNRYFKYLLENTPVRIFN